MNTNELAEQLDEYVGNNGYSHNDYADSMSQASTMLRQQQSEIEALKAHPVKELTDEEIHDLMDEIEVLVHGDIKRAMYRMARKVESILNV